MKQAERRFFLSTVIVISVWLLIVLHLHAGNSRLLPSWHGFLHSAIAARIPAGTLPPENPFFAGKAVPYYWVYHFCASYVGRIFDMDLLHTFQWMTLGSLVILLFSTALMGHRRCGSTFAGILAGTLALVGVNPLGPLIAIAKHLIRGAVLIDGMDSGSIVENMFVTNGAADRLMTQPLLPAMHIAGDWRHGQNIVWFLDLSSRGPALAMIMVLLFLFWGSNLSRLKIFGILTTSALITALNPLIGFATAGSIALAAGIFYALCNAGLWPARRTECTSITGGRDARATELLTALAPLAGALLAFPFYIQIIELSHGTFHFTTSIQFALLKSGAMIANFLILVPLAAASLRTNSQDPILQILALAGMLLVIAVPFVVLAPSNEHNLSNVAQCLLAVPAAEWITSRQKHKHAAFLCLLVFVPTTACTLFSFADRPALPLQFEGRLIHRVPADHPLERLYSWIRESTPADAVFVCDPNQTVKMSGNVSELPSFTERALLIDGYSYLTAPYEDYGLRKRIAEQAVAGQTLTSSQRDYLRQLQRPYYVVTYHAEEPALLQRLAAQYGAPVFHERFVAVFRL